MKRVVSQLLDLVYPPSCHFCSEPLSLGNYLCSSCAEELSPVEAPCCQICHEAFEGNIKGDFTCPNCHNLKFKFDFARSALRRTNHAHQLVIDLKYHKQRHLARTLAQECAELIERSPEIASLPSPVLIPVPMHWWRKLRRGFNQSEELATHLSKLTGIPVCTALRRNRHTRTQTRLSRNLRLKNLKNAFTCRHLDTNYRTAILVDDVFTTGSTTNACAIALRKGAPKLENIVVVTAMRG